MFFQQAIRPIQLLKVLPHVSECLFVVETKAAGKSFKLAVYKYQDSYFKLQDPRLFHQVIDIIKEKQGDESVVLPYIEQALEDNMYEVLKEWCIQFDLSVLSMIKDTQPVYLHYYEFFDNKSY